MAAYYLDTSAVVKRYVREQGTRWLRSLTDPLVGHRLYTVTLTGPEFVSGISRRVRGGRLPQLDAVRAITTFRREWRTHFVTWEIDDQILDRAMDLAESYGLRGYDALHLATAIELHQARQARRRRPVIFVSADLEQLRAAVAEGLSVDDPNMHP